MGLLCFCSVLCLLCLCARLFICALWSPAGKGLTQVNRMSRSRRVLATGGKQRIFWVRHGLY